MNKHEVGQKVWDTHNNYIYTLKSSKQAYGTTMWRVEENDFEWREDWFSDIPRYVQDLITKAEATEKELEEEKKQHQLALYDKNMMIKVYNEEKNKREELEKDVQRYFDLDNSYFALKGKSFQPKCNELYELKQKLSKVGNENE
jgi:predicted transcriptional regulator